MILAQISAALGPIECRLAVFKILEKLLKEAEIAKLDYELLELQNQEGEFVGSEIADILRKISQNPLKKEQILPKSLSFSLDNSDKFKLELFFKTWEGTIQWICDSPFRANHKRKNWFIGIQRLAIPEQNTINEKDLHFTFMRARGAGGQHVNKTNSAIRLEHIPTGLSVRVETARSQQQNRKLAISLIQAKLEEENLSKLSSAKKSRHQLHKEIERGKAIRIFKGLECIEIS